MAQRRPCDRQRSQPTELYGCEHDRQQRGHLHGCGIEFGRLGDQRQRRGSARGDEQQFLKFIFGRDRLLLLELLGYRFLVFQLIFFVQ